jgi:succinate dehydrogenase/fumarate reductase cytochrome b subunit
VEEVKQKMEAEAANQQQSLSVKDLMMVLFVGFGTTAVAHACADMIVPFIETHYPDLKKFSLTSSSFWVISLVTLFGLALSQTKARQIERMGASQFGSLFCTSSSQPSVCR